jgi:hypothetical protein
MKKMTGDSYLLIGIMVCTLAFGFISLTYPELKTKLVPGTVSGIVFVLAGIQLGKELSKKEKERSDKQTKADADDDFSEAPTEWRENMVGFAWLAGFLVGIYLVGFVIGILFFVFLFMKLNRFGWMRSIITAVLATATIYVVFIVVLRANLFTGIIIEALLA